VPEPFLRVDGLTGGYGASQVLFGVSLEVPEHGAVAVLGRNGAGKTTLVRTLLGHLPPTGGSVHLKGVNVIGLPPERLVRMGVGYMPQDHVVFPTLTVEENLLLGIRVLPRTERASIQEAYDLFPVFADRRRQLAGTMSGGERKLLGLARVMLGRPKLLVLDEPTEGVWHANVDRVVHILRDYSKGAGILIVEQQLEVVAELADHAIVLQRGEVVVQGKPRHLRNNAQLLGSLAPTQQ
jgi:branched-chain amino acid transport system ATP-binding protein